MASGITETRRLEGRDADGNLVAVLVCGIPWATGERNGREEIFLCYGFVDELRGLSTSPRDDTLDSLIGALADRAGCPFHAIRPRAFEATVGFAKGELHKAPYGSIDPDQPCITEAERALRQTTPEPELREIMRQRSLEWVAYNFTGCNWMARRVVAALRGEAAPTRAIMDIRWRAAA